MRTLLRLSLASSLLLIAGCGSSARTPGTPGGGSGSDGGTSSPSGARGQLAAGNFAGAHSGFVSGGDAAGACLTRIFRLVESSATTQLVGAFGWPSLPARDILGPQSLAGRAGARWSGSGRVEVGGRSLTLPRANVDVSGNITARDLVRGHRFALGYLSPGSSLTGTVDCATGAASLPGLTFLTFSADDEFCSLSTQVATGPGCNSSGGTVAFGAEGVVTVADVPVSCTIAGATRLSGRIEAPITDRDADAEGLHPLTREQDFEHFLSLARAGVTVEELVTMLQPWAAELTTAADECARAGEAGASFAVPGALWGGDDLTATPGDLLVVAGLADLAAGAVLIGGAYRFPLELAPLCPAGDCVEKVDFAARVNGAVGALRGAASIERARPIVSTGLDRLARGLARLDSDSALTRTAQSSAGIDGTRRWAEELRRSLDGSAVTLTDFSPAIRVDASRFFTAPPDPDAIAADMLVIEDGQLVFVEAFLDGLFGPSLDLDWQDGRYDEPELGEVLEALGDRMTQRGWLVER